MVKIKLTQGYTAIVDDEDGDLADYKWCVKVKGNGRRIYAVSHMGQGKKMAWLHRVILERMTQRPFPVGMESDHANGNTLDNRRHNLRIATRSQNKMNSKRRASATTRFRGVSRNGKNGWMARIGDGGKTIYLGTFRNEEEAARAYNEADIAEYGE